MTFATMKNNIIFRCDIFLSFFFHTFSHKNVIYTIYTYFYLFYVYTRFQNDLKNVICVILFFLKYM